MSTIVTYYHHGANVFVQKHLQGKHREHCLCWQCKRFRTDSMEENCKVARLLFTICQLHHVTTPVWECPFFKEKGDDAND